ncbi:MAG: ATP-grasp domain-containing protein [Bacillota bacterium]
MTVNVLITGMGQTIGIGILKALRMSRLNCRLLGTDCERKSAGLYMADKAFVVPKASSDVQEYLKEMAAICRRERADIVFIGSEPELLIFAPIAEEFTRETGTCVMVSSDSVIKRITDKWELFKFLSGEGFPVPESILPLDDNLNAFADRHGFPLIIKPRRGYASRSLQVITNQEELLFYSRTRKDIILQEYIKPDDQEYTVGVFVTRSGESRGAIVLRRELAAGLTFRAEVAQDEEITVLSRRIAERSGVIGPCNIQLRRSEQGPKVLEINPRFSSTVPIRAYFGYNEPAMAVGHFVLQKEITEPPIKKGVALRYWQEIYLP